MMTKREFLEQLQKMLARELDAGEVADHVRYYREYIDDAVRQGKTEEQVLGMLGDPRMIARTILDVGERRTGRGTVYTEPEDEAYRGKKDFGGGFYDDYQTEEDFGGWDSFGDRPHSGGGPGGFQLFLSGWKVWLALIVVLAVLFAVLGMVFTIFWKLLPFLLIGWAAVSVYRWLTRR